MRKKCEEILLKLGITPNVLAFTYIADAVEMIKSEPCRITDMYEVIGKKRKSTGFRVERAIRNAIGKLDPYSKEFEEYIGANIVNEETGNITNSKFLYTLAYRLKEDESEKRRDN